MENPDEGEEGLDLPSPEPPTTGQVSKAPPTLPPPPEVKTIDEAREVIADQHKSMQLQKESLDRMRGEVDGAKARITQKSLEAAKESRDAIAKASAKKNYWVGGLGGAFIGVLIGVLLWSLLIPRGTTTIIERPTTAATAKPVSGAKAPVMLPPKPTTALVAAVVTTPSPVATSAPKPTTVLPPRPPAKSAVSATAAPALKKVVARTHVRKRMTERPPRLTKREIIVIERIVEVPQRPATHMPPQNWPAYWQGRRGATACPWPEHWKGTHHDRRPTSVVQ